jgi:hypothetical protein
LLAHALASFAATSAWADPAAPPQGQSAAQDTGWQFALTPYLWLSGLHGDMGVSPRLPVVDVHLSPWDILSNFRFGAMGALEARHGRFVAAGDIMYVDVKFNKNIDILNNPNFLHADLRSQTFLSTDVVGYRVIEGPTSLDVLGGVRFNNVYSGLGLTGPRGNAAFGSVSKFWADPVLGLRLRGPIAGPWSYSLYGDVGGFGAASKITGQVSGMVDYAFARNWSAVVGWRFLLTDYEHGGFVYNAWLNGPVLGMTYRF